MKRVFLANDTHAYHSGCAQVIREIRSQLTEHKIIHTSPGMYKIRYDDWDIVDVLLINGEGTLHNNRPSAVGILDLAQRAQAHNVPVVLINTVWQNMDIKWKSVTDKLYYWSVRDVLSQEYAQKEFNRLPDFYLDLSVNTLPSIVKSAPVDIATGNTFESRLVTRFTAQHHSIFDNNWDDFVNKLRNTDMYISGRFHEIMGACAAQTPFIAIRGNSWKIEGMIHSSGIAIPTVDVFDYTKTQVEEYFTYYRGHFKDFYNWINSQQKLDILSIINSI